MDQIANTSTIGGERIDAVDHCLAGIARLSGEVKDASNYLPPYDQRAYSEAIKALSEKLQETRSRVAPKAKFSFKTSKKNGSAISLRDAAALAGPQGLPGYRSLSSTESSAMSTPGESTTTSTTPNAEKENGDDIDKAIAADKDVPFMGEGDDVPAVDGDVRAAAAAASIRKPSFSQSKSVNISAHASTHIIVPSTASHATSSGTLSSLRRCIVDMSIPTATGTPFASLAIKNVRDSLLVCGHVNGPAHITGVQNSVMAVACRQFRMHQCKGVDVYLYCGSRPIIEDCEDIRFAPMPESYITDSLKSIPNQWDQVDDFKWIKSEPSPHWSVIPSEKRIPENIWTEAVPGGPGHKLDDILKATIGQGVMIRQ
ncbi:TBCC-domain-containing protein [Xylona heveae TC161]|uniref:TBCC-domain-containing protein n=1 Tax=Xylona heveae (strain CBS 132557 / TC161) TaxID=1328760 RepID=A0A161TF01_XYLHT|nr:TBCC-domain-containing protein [Xylona heveae TC161]KZF24547.1 TBCC-domain-containing protein [Xylona heveae TC161]